MRACLLNPGNLNAHDAVVRPQDMIAHRSPSLLLICRESCNHTRRTVTFQSGSTESVPSLRRPFQSAQKPPAHDLRSPAGTKPLPFDRVVRFATFARAFCYIARLIFDRIGFRSGSRVLVVSFACVTDLIPFPRDLGRMIVPHAVCKHDTFHAS